MPSRARASALRPPPLASPRRAKEESKQQRRVTSGWKGTGAWHQGSLRSSRRRAAVTSQWRSRALWQPWALGFRGPGAPAAWRRRTSRPENPRAERCVATSTAAPSACERTALSAHPQAAPSRRPLPPSARVGGKRRRPAAWWDYAALAPQGWEWGAGNRGVNRVGSQRAWPSRSRPAA